MKFEDAGTKLLCRIRTETILTKVNNKKKPRIASFSKRLLTIFEVYRPITDQDVTLKTKAPDMNMVKTE